MTSRRVKGYALARFGRDLERSSTGGEPIILFRQGASPTTSSPGDRQLRDVLASNATIAISACVGFLTFSGTSYYEALFASFALKPGFLAIGQFDIAARGVWATLWACWRLIAENYAAFLVSIGLAIIIAVPIAVLSRRYKVVTQLITHVRPWHSSASRYNALALRWSIVLLAVMVGLIAGSKGGEYDAGRIQAARVRVLNCYVTKGGAYRGIVLAQDQSKTILVEPQQTRLIKNDDLLYVAECERLRTLQRYRSRRSQMKDDR
jgi:hypothetical protein